MKIFKNILNSLTPLEATQNTEERNSTQRIGICLSGGGALGYAHIGVLQALEDCGIYPDVGSGSSMGSVGGFAYAAGISPQDMMLLIKNDKLYRITSLMNLPTTFWKASGFSNHQKLKKLIKEICPKNTFESLKKELHVCVANLNDGEWEIINSGNRIDDWLAASASIPGVYSPIKIDDKIYVDGGLLNNMPAQPLKEKCSVIIGSNVVSHSSVKKGLKMQTAFLASIRTVEFQNSKEGCSLCDFLIEPNVLEKYHEFHFDAYQQIYQIGYSAVTKFIAENPEILNLKNK